MKLLKRGDRIGIVSPSAPATATAPRRYARARAYLESKGFEVVPGTLAGKAEAYRSGSIAARAAEINAFLRDDSVACVMSAIGGMNSNSLLPYLDYEAFARRPKVVVGYSDLTAILLALYARTGCATYYGPALVASFGELPPYNDLTWGYFEELLLREGAFPLTLEPPSFWTDERLDWESQSRGKDERPNDWICLKSGRAGGRLIGGNLNTMQGFFGTPYMPPIREGDILLIEDAMGRASSVERSFALLKCAGVFDRIGGLLLGKHETFDDQGSGRRPHEILKEVLGEPSFPVLAEFDCCHTHPMFTLPIGARVELDAGAKRLSILEPWAEERAGPSSGPSFGR